MSELKTFSERGLTFRDYLSHTFTLMGLGLLVSSIFAYLGGLLLKMLPVNIVGLTMIAVLIIEFVVAVLFSSRLYKMS